KSPFKGDRNQLNITDRTTYNYLPNSPTNQLNYLPTHQSPASPDSKKLNQHQPRYKSADMRAVGNPPQITAKHSQPADKLEQKPYSQRNKCRHFSQKIEHQNSYTVAGEEQYISPQHPGNCARGSQARNKWIQIKHIC